jgi:hypothetical protein
MTSRASGWAALCAVLAAIVLLMFPLYARGHEMHAGEHRDHPSGPPMSFLWGKHAQTGNLVNCCTFGSDNGDCRAVSPHAIEEADGPDGEPGFRYRGHWFSRKNTNASPDGRVYLCQHAGSPPHCAFVTESRS